jgi:hypothetical protein
MRFLIITTTLDHVGEDAFGRDGHGHASKSKETLYILNFIGIKIFSFRKEKFNYKLIKRLSCDVVNIKKIHLNILNHFKNKIP